MKKLLTLILCTLLIASFAIPASALKSIPVKGVSVDKSGIELEVGETYMLKVTFTPANTTQKRLIYSTDNKLIATVDAKGMIKAVKSGKTTIKVASYSNKKLAANCAVTVYEKTWKRNVNKPVTLDWYVEPNWFKGRWGQDLTSKYITKKTGVSINYIVNTTGGEEKINTLIASNDLPDFMSIGFWRASCSKIQQGGMAWDLNELAKKYDPYFSKVASKAYLSWNKLRDDGKSYAYPMYAVDPYNPPAGTKFASQASLMVRKDIYEAIGKPDMSTPEGFLKALKLAKEKFPAENNQPMIQLGFENFGNTGSYSENILRMFLGIPDVLGANGKYTTNRDNPEYLKWMKTFRKANEEGYISKSVYIDKPDQIKEKAAQGLYFAYLGTWPSFQNAISILEKQSPNKIYIAVNGPKGSKPIMLRGDYSLSGWLHTMIAKNTKHPDRAIQFMSYMISDEGQKDAYLGPEGVTWNMINGVPEYKWQVVDDFFNKEDVFRVTWGNMNTHLFLMDRATEIRFLPKKTNAVNDIEKWTYGKTVVRPEFDGIDPSGDSPEGIIKTKYEENWSKVLPKLLTASSDEEFDKIYNEEFAQYNQKIGYDKLLDFYTMRVKEKKAILGIK